MVETQGVWHISEFSEMQKKCPSWIYNLAEDYPSFGEYIKRANKILGRKMFKASMEKNPNQWVIKTFMPKLLGERETVKEAIHDEELTKATAKIKALQQELSSKGEIIEYLEIQKAIAHVVE